QTSIVLAWFITESLINAIWLDHIGSLNKEVEGQKRISKEREDILTGRDFTISIITNALELSGILPFPLFKDIDRVRRVRNKIVHGYLEYSPLRVDAELAIITATQLCKTRHPIEFNPTVGITISTL